MSLKFSLENSPGLAALLVSEYHDRTTAEQFVHWAQDALKVGHDSPSLLQLAIEEPPYFTPHLRHIFDAAVEEIGIEPTTPPQARVFFAQTVARELVAREAAPEAIAKHMEQLFPAHDAFSPFDVWSRLEEAFWCDYCRTGLEKDGMTLERAVREALQKLLAADWRLIAA